MGNVAFFLIFLFGLLFFCVGLKNLLVARSAGDWASARATIVECRIEEAERYAEKDIVYSLAVEYRFKFQNKDYFGSRVRLAETADFWGYATKRDADKYAVGKEVIVYFDPANPRDCLLERELSESNRTAVMGGLIFMIVALFFAYKINK